MLDKMMQIDRNRPTRFENDKKKPGENSFSALLDLIKRRNNLLKIAQGIVIEMDNVSLVCADVNFSLAISFNNGTIKHFYSEYEFRSFLNVIWFLLLLHFSFFFWFLEIFILLSFWFALGNFIFQIIIQ